MPLSSNERVTHLPQAPAEALGVCARALGAAGFRNIQVHEGAQMVTGEKRAFGQWTKGQLAVAVKPAETGAGSTVTVQSHATIQSLTSVVASPSRRLIDQVIKHLESSSAAPGTP